MSGDFELIDINTGKRLVIQMDGTEIRDQVEAPKVEFCDKCQEQKSMVLGEFTRFAGENILWLCEMCK